MLDENLPRIRIHNFFKKKRHRIFLALCHLPSESDILTTVAPNQTRLGPLETQHPELFRNIKFEEEKSSERPSNSYTKIGLEIKKKMK